MVWRPVAVGTGGNAGGGAAGDHFSRLHRLLLKFDAAVDGKGVKSGFISMPKFTEYLTGKKWADYHRQSVTVPPMGSPHQSTSLVGSPHQSLLSESEITASTSNRQPSKVGPIAGR